MAKTESNMFPLGEQAPDFSLLDVTTNQHKSLQELRSDIATVIFFICNHCPYVKHVQDQLITLANDYLPKKVAFIAISSNDVEQYPEDSPAKMKELAEKLHFPFPYLYDETQEVAKAYQAACTPDFYIFDQALKCVYRGQLDDSRPGNNIPVTGESIRTALDQLLSGQPITVQQKPSLGCNIKWKPE